MPNDVQPGDRVPNEGRSEEHQVMREAMQDWPTTLRYAVIAIARHHPGALITVTSSLLAGAAGLTAALNR